MSMLMLAEATVRKILAAAPTLSGIPATVIVASLRSCATPVMIGLSTSLSLSPAASASPAVSARPGPRATVVWVTQVPSLLLNEERTWIGML